VDKGTFLRGKVEQGTLFKGQSLTVAPSGDDAVVRPPISLLLNPYGPDALQKNHVLRHPFCIRPMYLCGAYRWRR
jgi:hypothetical protein